MINIEDVTLSDSSTSVEPNDNLWAELGNNTYDTKDILSELIDNSLAARIPNELVHVVLQIVVDDDGRPIKFIITDDAKGIPTDKLGYAIAPAGIQTHNSLNEHGLGMKQAIAALGKLDYLLTKTLDDSKAKLVKEFKFGHIPIYEIDYSANSGTEISIKDLHHQFSTDTMSITKKLIPYLGARYRKYLKVEFPLMSLQFQIINEDGSIRHTWSVTAVSPVYFHPATRDNRPSIHEFALAGSGWSATLTFGYAPKTDAEYEEMGIDATPQYSPYYVSLSKQGMDILIHDRVILFHQLSEIGIVEVKHPRFNITRGEINLKEGFSTAITKNALIQDSNFQECISQIREVLNGERIGPNRKKHDYLRFAATPEQLPEKLLRDRLASWLSTSPLNHKEHVNTEYVLEGIEGYIDVFADNEAYELKVNQASAYDVYQLYMYMDIGDISVGYLAADGFSTGAQIAARHLKEDKGVDLSLVNLSDFPIMNAPTPDELAQYY
jgi:hypothetical protein